ncbi:MAG: DNA-directed RNA polymerase subunit alpha [Candidatus Spechtbacteria bacterium]|nr:DNA-directed RNA polymerase subunit alpha [Candidatus Spechtbacteria bacterium]
MPSISLPKSPRVMEHDKTRVGDTMRTVVEIEDLYPGFGVTLGNALRRVLLSSIPGAAITSVKISGVNHEFSTIEGVLEDVLEITLNLKAIRIMLHGDESQRITLKVRGKKDVTAGDIETPSQVEIINKDAHIATLTDKNVTLEMEMEVQAGMGYESVAQRKGDKASVGVIPLDAIFTPVRKANFVVEDMRVGDRTDYNRVKFEIETDGSISPEAAFQTAVQVLVDQFLTLLQIETSQKSAASKETEEVEERGGEEAIMKMPASELKISTRTSNVLEGGGIKTVAGLVKKTEDDLLEVEGMGQKGVDEIKKALKKVKLSLKS